MEDDRIVAVGIDQSILGAAAEAGDCSSSQPLAQVVWERAAEVSPASLDPHDAPPLEDMFKASDGCLDFRKLRHRVDMAEADQHR